MLVFCPMCRWISRKSCRTCGANARVWFRPRTNTPSATRPCAEPCRVWLLPPLHPHSTSRSVLHILVVKVSTFSQWMIPCFPWSKNEGPRLPKVNDPAVSASSKWRPQPPPHPHCEDLSLLHILIVKAPASSIYSQSSPSSTSSLSRPKPPHCHCQGLSILHFLVIEVPVSHVLHQNLSPWKEDPVSSPLPSTEDGICQPWLPVRVFAICDFTRLAYIIAAEWMDW